MSTRKIFMTTLVLAALAGCQDYPQGGDVPLSPFASSKIAKYAPGADLSNLTMSDYRQISNIIHSGDGRGNVPGQVQTYIRNVNNRVAG